MSIQVNEILFSVSECTALKEMRLYVPPAVIQGHKAILNCLFDLEGDKLYTVKWYRGVAEFYRYVLGTVVVLYLTFQNIQLNCF